MINWTSHDPEILTVSLAGQFGKNLTSHLFTFLFGELYVVFFPFLFPPLHNPSV